MQVRSLQSGVLAIPAPTHSPKPSSACSRPRSSTLAVLGEGLRRYATLEWIDWFNHRRRLEPIGNIPPAEDEATYHQSTSQVPMAA